MTRMPKLFVVGVGVSLLLTAPPTEGTSAQAPPAIAGLVSWWPGSNARDVSGPNDGSLMNGAAIVSGKIGRGFGFDGIDDFVLVPYHPSLDLAAQGSLAFWMRADPSNPMTCAPACQGLVTTDHFMVEISPFGPGGGVNFVVATTTGSDPVFHHTSDANGGVAAPVPAGEWHHIAGTYDGVTCQLYVDGLPWGNPTPATGVIAPMEAGGFLAIGSEDGRGMVSCPNCYDDRRFHGDIDEVALYNRALTPQEVQALFRRGRN
jgi:hypothetical protein